MSWNPARAARGSGARPSLELAVLSALAGGHDTVPAAVTAVGATPADVERVLRWAGEASLVRPVVTARGPGFALTERGSAVVEVQHVLPGASSGGVDLGGVARKVGELSEHARHGRDAIRERRQAGVLLEPQAREGAVDLLNAAYVRGVIDHGERERRVSLALAAQNRGELRSATDGLPEPPRRPRSATLLDAAGEMRRTLLAIAAVLAAGGFAVVAVIVLIIVLGNR